MFNGDTVGKRGCNKMKIMIFSGFLALLFILVLPACAAKNGSIVILEDGHGTGFTIYLTEFSSENKCEMSLSRGDEVLVKLEDKEDGVNLAIKIDLSINGKKGSEPYTGKDLKSGMFTFTVYETDEYVFRISGKGANGKLTVKNLGSGSE